MGGRTGRRGDNDQIGSRENSRPYTTVQVIIRRKTFGNPHKTSLSATPVFEIWHRPVADDFRLASGGIEST